MDSWKMDIGRKIMRTRDAKLSDYDVPKEDEAMNIAKSWIQIFGSFFLVVQYQKRQAWN